MTFRTAEQANTYIACTFAPWLQRKHKAIKTYKYKVNKDCSVSKIACYAIQYIGGN